MTPRKSRLCGTMALPSPWPYYPLPCICVPFLRNRQIRLCGTMALLRVHLLSNRRYCFWVAEPLRTRCCFLAPFDHMLQHHCVLLAVLLGRWTDRL
ncbi:hypothetical protein BHE74_00033506 [Ensete ventricosum]|nr:hypothetical protein BHE74_00033506 [Ensete ventricosum]RZS25576.1 hypothetical protein BHM03_00058797 [Ensete ventricosum]